MLNSHVGRFLSRLYDKLTKVVATSVEPLLY